MAGTQQPPRSGGRPGAMTMAMQAVKTVSGPKVLRIGVIQGGKIIEERIVRNRETVSVGTTEKNTFTIVAPEFPAHFELFQMVGGTYKLNFTDTMEGRIATPQGVQSLQQLKQSGNATRSNVGHQFPLNEQCRGKVSVGDVTFLFQFVAPPPPQPRPQLPAAIRSGWVKNIDWTYNACLASFLVIAFSALAYVEYLYDPEIEDSFSLDVRTVALVTPPPIEEPQQQQEQGQQEDQAAQAQNQQQQQPTHEQHHESQASAEARATRSAAAAERAASSAAAAAERAAAAALASLQNSAEFAALTTAGAGRGQAVDRLASGGLMGATVDALANASGVANGGSGTGLRRSGAVASAGGIGSGTLGASRTTSGGGGSAIGSGEAATETRVSGRASMGGGGETGGDGELDAGRVAAVIRGALAGIKACYERALRNNPTLAGRLTVNFSVGTSGRAAGVSTSGLNNAPDVGTCVAGRVRGLVFPAAQGGSVSFSFPFNFSPGS